MKGERLIREPRLAGCAIAVTLLLLMVVLPADYKLAVAYYNQGNYQKAIDELKPDLEANPNWEFGYRLTGLCHLALKHYSLTVTSLSKAVQLKSTTFSTYLGLAQAYFNLDKFDSCIETLNQGETAAKDVDKLKLSRLRGSAYYRQQKYPEAINEIQSVIQQRAAVWSDYSELGIAYYRIEKIEEAIQALSKAITLKPDHALSSEILGKCYFKQGVAALSTKKYPFALELFKKVVDLNPKDGFAYYNMAECLLFLKKYSEAEKVLNQAIALNPQSSEAYLRLGLVFEKQNKRKEALAAYQKSNEIKPTSLAKESLNRLKSPAKSQ